MSASLVGSEMCIRDRLGPPGRARSPPEDLRHRGRRDRPPPGAWLRPSPVSYTHLTLPTICSV
eukprot:11528665-Alexandrium_andersonii.AAC.1